MSTLAFAMDQGLGTPNTPAIRFTRGTVFEASLVRNCYGLSGCSPPWTDLTGLPANGGFYIQAFDGSVALPVAGYDYNSDWTPCMGLFLSRSFNQHVPIFPSFSFFVRLKARFFVPTRTVGRRRAQELSRSAVLCRPPPARPRLDSPEHGGTRRCGRAISKMTLQRGARGRARIYRATTLYSVGPRTRTMMQ